ncbi:ATPase family AAA domain-containing protein 5 [Cytospora mali]|uniref:ATPase family AAA domain-containing protein 5 n=1 Tax=Cytospora mali TaxID=578113 RepID=A0A194VN94_CYTMA|nr:ATPase family AAA domain-containing protein 5 [Valsa mali]
MAGGTLAFEPKKLHPFFAAPKSLRHDPNVTNSPAAATADNPTAIHDTNEAAETNSDMDAPEDNTRQRKRRKKAEDVDQDGEDTKKPRRGRKKANPQGASIINLFSRINGEDRDEAPEQSVATQDDTKDPDVADVPSSAAPAAENDCTTGVAPAEESRSGPDHEEEDQKTPPKKMLRLNLRTGTIGSPPKQKEPEVIKEQKQTENAAEEKATATPKGKRHPTRIARLVYGTDDVSRQRIGAQIDEILNSPVAPSSRRKKRTSPKSVKLAQDTKLMETEDAQKKETHPFFTGKSKKTATISTTTESLRSEPVKSKPAPSPTRPRIFSSTPMSPKKTRKLGPSKPFPQFGMKSMGLKTPGARIPAWPWKDMVHIRGDCSHLARTSPNSNKPLLARKSKGNTTHLSPQETILNDFIPKLGISEATDAVKNIDTGVFLPPPPELRLPEKHFESGVKLEKRILPELKNIKHPALERLRELLTTSLSAFDKYQCESFSWSHKYAPVSAVEVLQYGKEAFLLRDWLQALKVLSVHTGDGNANDEEANEMGEVSDSEEEDWSPNKRGGKKTVIRAGDTVAKDSKNAPRLTNTVVISGAHGCGKTSAVYAIAKELDFEVFEINPGSRRSGKDILEKIGDMTRNHLVQQQQADSPVTEAAIDEDEVAQDIESGKQATMSAFFKPNAAPKPAKAKKPNKKEETTKPEQKKSPPKNQKQSLILLDEIDILYEEDKQFWTTVIGLIAQSKRPFILTCNDENLVPLQALNLHGIFRFSSPPTDLAVDRLLMIAACEGHALRRNAVEALFESRQQDLRACLMDLNYWCQIGVGDRRSGVDWYYPRWPKGVDIDDDGNVIRVVSQDTYIEGMGWVAHDVLVKETDQQSLEEELMREVWDYWQLDLGNWQDSLDLTSWAETLNTASSHHVRLSILEKYGDFTDAMSVADLSSAMAFASGHEEAIDCTLPDMTAKARDDFILGRQLLDAPVASTYNPLAISLPINLRRLAREDLHASYPSPELDQPTEDSVISKVRQNASQSSTTPPITRDDFSLAFDTLAASEKATPGSYLDPSVFDGTLSCIVLDIGPYVRSIVAYDNELQQQRLKMSNLLSRGGTKRMRNTRASHAALEGGSRSTTRPERWFKADVNGYLVKQTAGEGWAEALKEEMKTDSDRGSVVSSRALGRGRILLPDDDDSSDELGSSSVGLSSGGMDVD